MESFTLDFFFIIRLMAVDNSCTIFSFSEPPRMSHHHHHYHYKDHCIFILSSSLSMQRSSSSLSLFLQRSSYHHHYHYKDHQYDYYHYKDHHHHDHYDHWTDDWRRVMRHGDYWTGDEWGTGDGCSAWPESGTLHHNLHTTVLHSPITSPASTIMSHCLKLLYFESSCCSE